MSRTLLITIAVAAVSLLSGETALAQCALCRTAAAAQNPEAASALNLGILVLLIPAAVIFNGIFLLAYRCRDSNSGRNGETDLR